VYIILKKKMLKLKDFLLCLSNLLKVYFVFELKGILFKIIYYLAGLIVYKDDFFLKILKKITNLKIFKDHENLRYYPSFKKRKKAVNFIYKVLLRYKKNRIVFISWESLLKIKLQQQAQTNKGHSNNSTFLFKPFNQAEPFYSTS